VNFDSDSFSKFDSFAVWKYNAMDYIKLAWLKMEESALRSSITSFVALVPGLKNLNFKV